MKDLVAVGDGGPLVRITTQKSNEYLRDTLQQHATPEKEKRP
jgi:hypothetical protein